jgi:uncharacterized membrane protein YhaH (DUF805 family)
MKHVKSALSQYSNFKGRATRAEFWTFFLFFFGACFIAGFLDGILGTGFITPIIYLGLLVPYFACAVRRIHDVNKSGWLVIVPIYNLVLLCSSGKQPDIVA